MADRNSVRQRIIASVFTRRNAQGNLAETYVSHLKIWEDADDGRKARYILLSQAANRTGYIHKSKLNTNGSFSVGKTWNLPELHGIHVLNPMAFDIILARKYHWQTENEADQQAFLDDLIRLFRAVAGNAPLQLQGISEPPLRRHPPPPDLSQLRASSSSSTAPPPTARPPRLSETRTPSQSDRELEYTAPSIPLALQPRTVSQPRSVSPPNASRYPPSAIRNRSVTPGQRSRPPSPAQSVASITPAVPRPLRTSNAASISSQIPFNLARSSSPQLAPPQRLERANGASSPTPSEGRAPTPSIRSRAPSPAPSTSSRKPSESIQTDGLNDSNMLQPRPTHTARVSFFDPGNQALLDRLIMAGQVDAEGEEENAQATMTSVEEMLEGYEWASDDIIGQKIVKGTADLIEARLLDELMALEKANIHSFLEADDRIGMVIKYMDDAIAELDSMESSVSSYKIHLNAVSDDISFIQSQNRGLQVQTQNQKILLDEIQKLLRTTHVDRDSLLILTQESLEKPAGITRLEEAAAQLYKALQAGRDNDMAATMERLEEYRTHNHQFAERVYRYLEIAFTYQSTLLLRGTENGIKSERPGRATLINHKAVEDYLGRYAGLMLYLKEMDEAVYAKICVAYFSAGSDLHGQQIRALLSFYQGLIKRAPEDDAESNFAGTTPTSGTSRAGAGMRRAGTIIRSPIEARRERDKDKRGGKELRAFEAFGFILEQVAPVVFKEDEFIADFLQINDATFTYADYMGLDNYFRRQASRTTGLSQPTLKLIRGAMDFIFGFLPAELKTWLDAALAKDEMQIIGLLVTLERFITDAEEKGNGFFFDLLAKQNSRLKGLFERHVSEQIKMVEQTKVNSKKRRGVAPFIKYFPAYIGRIESQLVGADTMEVRTSVDAAYDRIVQSMFESLKHMAKMEGEGEDKGQLNYHVILIENMHHFVAEIGRQEVGSVSNFVRRAESLYDENLNAYVRIVLRRPFSRIIDYFEGVERLLKTTAPTEIASNSNYNKSALKKVVKEYNAKDIRKIVDALFKRVEKHYTEASEKTTTEETGGIAPGTVMVGVWRACEEELLRITELFGKRIAQCYVDSGVTLEYTAKDVTAAFSRHRA